MLLPSLFVSWKEWDGVLYIIEKCTVHISLGEANVFCIHHHDLMTPFYMGSSADDICVLLFVSLWPLPEGLCYVTTT